MKDAYDYAANPDIAEDHDPIIINNIENWKNKLVIDYIMKNYERQKTISDAIQYQEHCR